MQKCLARCLCGVFGLFLVGVATNAEAESKRPATREEFHQQIEESVAKLNAQRNEERRAAEIVGRSAQRGDGWVCEGAPAISDADFDGGDSMRRGSSMVYEDGSVIHAAWNVDGSVEVHRLGFRGERSRDKVVELNGSNSGAISQTITGLQAGAYYQFTFDYAIHPDANEADANWSLGDEYGSFESTTTADNQWETMTVYFTASSSTALLEFDSDTAGTLGMMIDNVEITCIPPTYIGLDLPVVLRNKEGEAVSYAVVTEDGTPTAFYADELPHGLTLDEDTGVISGTIDAEAAGTYYVEVSVDGQTGDWDEGGFVWEVFSVGGLVLDLPLNEIIEIDDFSGEHAYDDEYEYYTMDESPYESEALLVPDAHVVAGPEDSALMFDEDRFLVLETEDHQSLRGEFSFSGWVKSGFEFDEHRDGEGRGFWPEFVIMKGDPLFAARGEGYLTYYIVQFYDEMEVGFMLEDEDGDYDIFWAYTELLPLEQWFHLGVTADDDGCEIYLNGQVDMTFEFPEGWRLADMGGPIFAGQVPLFGAGEGDDMSLSLDELQVYDRVLSAEEMAEIGEQPRFSFTSPDDQTNETGDVVSLPINLTGPYLWLEVDGLPEGLTFDVGDRRIVGELTDCDSGVYYVDVFVVDLEENEHYGEFRWVVSTPDGGLVDNWSFEGSPAVPENRFVRYEEDDFIYGVWEVTSGTVDVHHVGSNRIGSRLPGDGTQVLELNGGSGGTVTQVVDGLVDGNSYMLTFLYSGHPNARINSARVVLDDAEVDETFHAGRGYTPRGTPWQKYTLDFVADGTEETISFVSLDTGSFGMAIDQVELICTNGITVREDHGLPFEPSSNQQLDVESWSLSMSRPNPFTEGTTIRFNVAERSPVDIAVFSVDGRRVRTLVDGYVDVGTSSVEWDGQDEAGREVSSGTYVIRMASPNFTENRRVVRIR